MESSVNETPSRTPMQAAPAIAVYDPPMCCSTGLCGPSVDPTLLRVARDLRWLETQGMAVERFNLAQQPAPFVENQRVAGLLQAFGDRALPVTLVNGEVAFYGRYPSRDDLLTAIGQASSAHTSDRDDLTLNVVSTCDCEPGSGCC